VRQLAIKPYFSVENSIHSVCEEAQLTPTPKKTPAAKAAV
jgi:hypothetical protein